jgi:hypothetical protein
MIRATAIIALAALAATPALAQQAVTVASLLGQEFTVVGTIASNIGPGVFLQKKDKLFLCFISETPASPAVTTRYCKPVH